MAACRLVYDSRHLQADCQEPEPAPEFYAWQSSMGYFYLFSGNSFIIFLRINLLNFAHFKQYEWCLFLKTTGKALFKARPGPINATQRFRGLKHYSLLSRDGIVVLCSELSVSESVISNVEYYLRLLPEKQKHNIAAPDSASNADQYAPITAQNN